MVSNQERIIMESGFKLRADYNGTHTVDIERIRKQVGSYLPGLEMRTATETNNLLLFAHLDASGASDLNWFVCETML